MRLSIVVIFHDMPREAPRTLASLSMSYQEGVTAADFEVIAIDNASAEPIPEAVRASLPNNVRYRYFDTGSVSPAAAVNAGAGMARGELLAVIVDGARMASPGLVANTLRAGRLFDEPLIGTLAFHLGPDVQNVSMTQGYDQVEEDRLLAEIGWPANGYGLFEISVLAQSSRRGMLGGLPPELSWLCLRRTSFTALGGFDTRFTSPGGGLVNHHFRDRALARPGVQPVMILGEGVFHQFHGGVATNVPMSAHPFGRFHAEYNAICGGDYATAPSPPSFLLGMLRPGAQRFFTEAD